MSTHTDKPSSHTPEQSAPTTDQSGKPVDVVHKDIAHENPATEGVDKVITPTSIKEEQDAETLRAKNRELERKLNGQG